MRLTKAEVDLILDAASKRKKGDFILQLKCVNTGKSGTWISYLTLIGKNGEKVMHGEYTARDSAFRTAAKLLNKTNWQYRFKWGK